MKLNCTKKEAEEYSNTFTANAEGDPMIFLHREVSGKETVAYYNDNSTTGKDFNWKSGGGKDPTIESNVAETDTTIIDDHDKGKFFNDELKGQFPNL